MMQIHTGVIEDVNDPLKLGRVRVRVLGLHTDDKSLIPTESLPWASVTLPTTSASMSGIGHSATGLLPGSWVVLVFQDSECQYPLVLGSFHGIPADDINQQVASEEVSFESAEYAASVPITKPNQVTTGEVSLAVDVKLTGLRRAKDFLSVTDECINLIKSEETFSSVAYFDVDSYSIGYGSKKIKGKVVVAGQTITESEAHTALLDYVNTTALPEVQKAVKVLVTQSMVDALVSINYNMGGPKFRKTRILADLNSEKYLQAATNFKLYTADSNGKQLNGLVLRRNRESTLFLKDGLPSTDSQTTQQELSSSAITSDAKGNITSINTNKVLASRGFTDPQAVYPLYRNEPDTNRLARHQNIDKTIVYRKEAARLTGVRIANSDTTWDQSLVPYNALYPNNKVYGTSSGHIFEFDDTPLSRRIHLYHSAGTFIEIDDNGTQVNRIVGDGYEILERNGYVSVKGALNVTIEGNHNLRVGGKCNIEIAEGATINVSGNVALNVNGNLTQSVSGDMLVKVGGTYSVDARTVLTNSGGSAGVSAPPSVPAGESPTFTSLNVVTRSTESAMEFESPDEGSAESYNANRLENGTTTREELLQGAETISSAPASKPANVVSTSCGDIHSRVDFPATLVLSKYFTIGDLNKNGSRPIIAQMGLKPSDIACNLKMVCINVLDTVKDLYPNMIITSGFRRPGDAVNSSKTSRHYYGEAVDIQLPGFSKADYLDAIKNISSKVPYDQLILEYSGSNTTWIHISFKVSGSRGQAFTMHNHKRISDYGEFKLIA